MEKAVYNGLSGPSVELLESDKPISSEQAAMIFEEKNYSDAPMRGRTSYKPLERFGFAIRKEGRVRITKLGHRFLNEDSDITDIFTRSLLKWQLPNPLDARSFRARDGYNIKPFVAALHVIAKVNERSNAQPGITLNEFQIFLLTLIDCRDIEACVADLLDYRQRSKPIKIEHIAQFEHQAIMPQCPALSCCPVCWTAAAKDGIDMRRCAAGRTLWHRMNCPRIFPKHPI